MRTVCILALMATAAFASQGWSECAGSMVDPSFTPYTPPGAAKVCSKGTLAIAYDPTMLNPAISQYYITPQEESKLIPGRDSFYEDPDLQAMGVPQAPVNSDIFNQSWNRGHCAPSHILSYSADAKESCYTMANIAPQWGFFNQQPWAQLEGKVADFIAAGNTSLFMITGVAHKDRATAPRGPDNIAYPTWYIKVICDPISGNAAGFYGLNDPSMTANVEFVPVAQIEGMYGGPLFPPHKCNVNKVNRNFWWA